MEKYSVLHVTPNFYSVIKGGEHVLEMARRCPDYEFVIVGSEGHDETLKNVHFVGKINDQKELSKYYSMADVCLLTSVRETFSMVCAESLCCGTVVAGFEAGGPEKIALPQYSQFVEQGNDDNLEDALRNMAEQFHDKRMVSEAGIINYGQKTMCEKYYRVYRSLYKKQLSIV